MASGHSRREPQTGGTLRVLYVDDPSQTDAVTDLVETAHDDISLLTENGREAAREQAAGDRFDCVVTELKFATAVSDILEETPLVLFTETDPTAISDALLDRADTLVQKGEQTHIAFLLDKVRGVAGGEEAPDDVAEPLAAMLPDTETATFLLAPDGTVEWASTAPGDFFDIPEGSGPLHDRLSAAALGTRGYTDRMARAVATEEMVRRQGLELPAEDGTADLRCWSYLREDGSRIEVYQDVSAQVERAARLDRLDRLVDLARDGLYMIDADARYAHVTERYAEMLGYTPDELEGEHASTVMGEGALRRGQRAVERLLRDPDRDSAVVDQTHQTRDGDEVPLSIHFTTLTDDDGDYDGLMCIARDVTERRRREQELAEYKTVFESVFDRVYVLGDDGRIRLANEPFASLFGRTAAELEGTHASEVFGVEGHERIRSVVEEVTASGEDHGAAELAIRDADGTEVPCETHVSLLPPDGDGGYSGCVGVLRDISERVQREEQVAVLDRVLRHNLRNDLTVVLGRAELLADRIDDPAKQALVDTITGKTNELMEFAEKARRAQRVLDAAMTQSTDTVELDDIVETVLDGLQGTQAADVRTDIPPGLTAECHETLSVALSDLVVNGIVHNDSQDPVVELAARERGDVVEIRVGDNGPGIPEAERRVLTDGTETPLQHGSGIGLWLVHWIVSQSNGAIRVEDRAPRGSVVVVELPTGR